MGEPALPGADWRPGAFFIYSQNVQLSLRYSRGREGCPKIHRTVKHKIRSCGVILEPWWKPPRTLGGHELHKCAERDPKHRRPSSFPSMAANTPTSNRLSWKTTSHPPS